MFWCPETEHFVLQQRNDLHNEKLFLIVKINRHRKKNSTPNSYAFLQVNSKSKLLLVLIRIILIFII